jgi:hypothetical protein
MSSMTLATLRETGYDEEQDLSRMNDEGCPNDPLAISPNRTGIESVCEPLGQMLERPESLGCGVSASQPLLGLVGAVRSRLTAKLDEKLNLDDEGDIISAIIGYREVTDLDRG